MLVNGNRCDDRGSSERCEWACSSATLLLSKGYRLRTWGRSICLDVIVSRLGPNKVERLGEVAVEIRLRLGLVAEEVSGVGIGGVWIE